MTDAERFPLQCAVAAVENGDMAALESSSKQLEEVVFDQGYFSDETVRALSETIESDAYARVTDGVFLLKSFEYNLELMTDSQAKEFARAVVSFVPKAHDEIAAFLAVELIAELWKDERSVDALIEIRDTSTANVTLALVAHGFHWLAKKSAILGVKDRAAKELEALSKHPSSEVSVEAVAALNRINRVS